MTYNERMNDPDRMRIQHICRSLFLYINRIYIYIQSLFLHIYLYMYIFLMTYNERMNELDRIPIHLYVGLFSYVYK